MTEEENPERAVRDFIEWQQRRIGGRCDFHKRYPRRPITSPRWGAFLFLCGMGVLLILGVVVVRRVVGGGEMGAAFWAGASIPAAVGLLFIVSGLWWLAKLQAEKGKD